MIRQLTGIRAVLAWWVVLLHVLSNPKVSGIVPFSGAFSSGYLAVDGFFILSGFILCYVYEEKFSVFSAGTYRTYLVARLARIYPIHLLMLAAFAPIAIANRWLHLPNSITSFSLPDLGLNLLLVQAWGLIDHPSWNGVAWSISAEWFVYLLLPLFLLVVVRGESALHLVKLFVIVIVCVLVLHWVKGVQDTQGIKGIYSTALALSVASRLFCHRGFATWSGWELLPSQEPRHAPPST